MTDRIYVMDTDQSGERYRAGYFNPVTAECWHGDTYWDGSNHRDINTGDQWSGERLFRTAQGRWVLMHWSNWQGTSDSYEYLDETLAAEWLLFNNQDKAHAKYFGDWPEEQGPPAKVIVVDERPRYWIQFREPSTGVWERCMAGPGPYVTVLPALEAVEQHNRTMRQDGFGAPWRVVSEDGDVIEYGTRRVDG